MISDISKRIICETACELYSGRKMCISCKTLSIWVLLLVSEGINSFCVISNGENWFRLLTIQPFERPPGKELDSKSRHRYTWGFKRSMPRTIIFHSNYRQRQIVTDVNSFYSTHNHKIILKQTRVTCTNNLMSAPLPAPLAMKTTVTNTEWPHVRQQITKGASIQEHTTRIFVQWA